MKTKELVFTGNSTTEWMAFKTQFQNIFWEDLKANILRDVKAAIQDQIHEDFEEQIGAKQYERTPERKAERLGKRYRTLETEYALFKI